MVGEPKILASVSKRSSFTNAIMCLVLCTRNWITCHVLRFMERLPLFKLIAFFQSVQMIFFAFDNTENSCFIFWNFLNFSANIYFVLKNKIPALETSYTSTAPRPWTTICWLHKRVYPCEIENPQYSAL